MNIVEPSNPDHISIAQPIRDGEATHSSSGYTDNGDFRTGYSNEQSDSVSISDAAKAKYSSSKSNNQADPSSNNDNNNDGPVVKKNPRNNSTDQNRKSENRETDSSLSQTSDGIDLSDEEDKKVRELQKRDQEVRQHEQAHLAAAGHLANGGTQLEYVNGPDGRQYASGGHVNISIGGGNTPEERLQNAQQAERAALAPTNPSAQDRKVASAARKKANESQKEISDEKAKDLENTSSSAKQEINNINDVVDNENQFPTENPDFIKPGLGASTIIDSRSSESAVKETERKSSNVDKNNESEYSRNNPEWIRVVPNSTNSDSNNNQQNNSPGNNSRNAEDENESPNNNSSSGLSDNTEKSQTDINNTSPYLTQQHEEQNNNVNRAISEAANNYGNNRNGPQSPSMERLSQNAAKPGSFVNLVA
ncbi:MAG: putative metalloprotease CJM1_0395 family protein [Candidatus Electryonea clarkiae]|nr:putative metalloprotease CJM1_0395 family protein [Candidatus Electryonea clarkiae]MDP8285883.1 putative metalloprotease CJM1_0395 family protein [Candidatus Electryonea clarkiae]